MSIRIYGASDDLLEVDGDVVDEFYIDHDQQARVRLTSPAGESLDVVATFCVDDDAGPEPPALAWTLAVHARDYYPSWPIRFAEREDYEGDPMVVIDAPVGTTVEQIGMD